MNTYSHLNINFNINFEITESYLFVWILEQNMKHKVDILDKH